MYMYSKIKMHDFYNKTHKHIYTGERIGGDTWEEREGAREASRGVETMDPNPETKADE